MQLTTAAITQSNSGPSPTRAWSPQSGILPARGARRIATRRSRRRESADQTALRESAASRQRLPGAFSRHLEPLARHITRATRNPASQSRNVAALTCRLDALSGNASAQSDDLKTLTGDIDALNDNAETPTGRVGVLKSDVDTLPRDRGALKDNADALNVNVFASQESHNSLNCISLHVSMNRSADLRSGAVANGHKSRRIGDRRSDGSWSRCAIPKSWKLPSIQNPVTST